MLYIPAFIIFDHSVQDDKELAHTGCKGDLRRFSGLFKTFIKRLNSWVETRCGNGCHVKHGSQSTSAAPDDAFTFEFSAVAVHRRNANKGCYLFAVQASQLWKAGNEHGRKHGALRRRSSFSIHTGEFCMFFFMVLSIS